MRARESLGEEIMCCLYSPLTTLREISSQVSLFKKPCCTNALIAPKAPAFTVPSRRQGYGLDLKVDARLLQHSGLCVNKEDNGFLERRQKPLCQAERPFAESSRRQGCGKRLLCLFSTCAEY